VGPVSAPTSRPLVSIVIPCYNQARFLAEAIESALGQTYSAVEVIVVDDGSTDDTRAIAARFATVQYVYRENGGASRARNTGFRVSSGQLLLFLDADDRLLPDAVSLGVAALDENPSWVFITGHVRLIHADGSLLGTPPQNHAGGDQFIALLRSNYIWTPGAVIYRRDILDRDGHFDPAAGASADYELNLRLARWHPIGCHHQVVLDYRRHDANMTSDVEWMLRSAVSVRLAQRRCVEGNPEAERAWREGIEIVRADYGERLLHRVKCDIRTRGRRWRAIAGAIGLARYYPAGLLRALVRGSAPLESS
jgi:glycosyltransferase involved in cell wall biosynthesis